MQNKRATIVAVGVFLFLGGCDFDDRNVDSAESSRSVNLVSEEGEPDPSAPIDAQYSVVFPLKSDTKVLLGVKATALARGIEKLSLRVRTYNANGIATLETTPSEIRTGGSLVMEAPVEMPAGLSIHEVYVLGHYWHGGVYPLEMQMLKTKDGLIDLRRQDDDEEPVVVVDGSPDRSQEGNRDGGEE